MNEGLHKHAGKASTLDEEERTALKDMQSLVELHLPKSVKIDHPFGHSNNKKKNKKKQSGGICLYKYGQLWGEKRRQAGIGILWQDGLVLKYPGI